MLTRRFLVLEKLQVTSLQQRINAAAVSIRFLLTSDLDLYAHIHSESIQGVGEAGKQSMHTAVPEDPHLSISM